MGVACSGYVMVVGMAVPMSSKARRCRIVGVARMSMVVPAMRVVLRVRVARWSRTPVKERTGRTCLPGLVAAGAEHPPLGRRCEVDMRWAEPSDRVLFCGVCKQRQPGSEGR